MENNSVLPVEKENQFAQLIGLACEYMFKKELPNVKEAMKITHPNIDMEDEKVVDLILLGYKVGISSVIMKNGR